MPLYSNPSPAVPHGRLAARASARTELSRALLFAVAYFAGSEVGYSLSLGPSVGGTFWPPSGISLAVFLAARWRSWPALLVAGLAANFLSDALHGQRLATSIGFAAANLGEPLLGAFLLRRMLRAPVTFTRLSELIALAAIVVFVAAPVGAAIGALTAEAYTMNPPGFWRGWQTWWVGDAVGALVLTPFVFRVIADWRRISTIAPATWLEAAALTVVLLGATQLIFTAHPASTAMPFLVYPVLLWASVRFGLVAVGAALCVVVLLTTHDTANGQGPFAAAHLSLADRLVALQTYVGVMALSFHGLALLWEERTRTAAALRLAHSGLAARYHRIVEQSPLAILTVRGDGTVRDANPAWRRLWPARAGGPNGGGVDAEDGPQIEPLIERAFTGTVVELPEHEVPATGDPRGSPRRVRGVAYPVTDEEGAVTEVVLIARDITEEVGAQQQLLDANRALREREEALSHAVRQMEDAQAHREELLAAERFARSEAERASRLKDEFLATLSHELRTPLNAIVGWAHILRQKATDPALAPAVETIERNARAQAKLIDDLLDMTSIMAGKVGLTIAPVPIADVVVSAAEALRPMAEARGVGLSIDVQEGGVLVSCDSARIQQVVANLLSNGVKFTPAGGQVHARVLGSADAAQIVVRDTGQGIPPEFLPAVFERFRQADGSITRRHGGLGLGLSIARHIVERHGGSITAHSEGVGRGAVFTVTLPVGDVTAPVGPADEMLPPSASPGLRVLVVDDEADARELLRRLLIEQGCEVECAGSADEALAALGAVRCDILLTDIGMPGTDGYELLRRARATDGHQPRAIAVTAFARPEDRDRALAAGFEDHIAKPVHPTLLLRALTRAAVPPPDPSPRSTAGDGSAAR